MMADLPGPLDPAAVIAKLRDVYRATSATGVGYDPWEARLIEPQIPRGRKVTGREAMTAAARFAAVVDSGQLAHDGTGTLTLDVTRTVRKPAGPRGWYAAPASADAPTTAAQAAIRAVWLASAPPRPTPTVR
jgi:hypothetical protein